MMFFSLFKKSEPVVDERTELFNKFKTTIMDTQKYNTLLGILEFNVNDVLLEMINIERALRSKSFVGIDDINWLSNRARGHVEKLSFYCADTIFED